jgi:hypothetical protein
LALACKVRTPTHAGRAASELWAGRRSPDGRLAVNEHHPDFPLLLAEAMDFLSAEGWQPSAAAQRLGVSASQLIKLLQKEPQAFATLNREREKLGLGAMR